MRDPNRIKPYCDALITIWEMIPDWRLSQLMINAIETYKEKYSDDPFYMEDQDFLMYLYNYVSKLTKKN